MSKPAGTVPIRSNSKTPRRYWLALHPDVARPIGGVKQMHRFGEALIAAGRDATLIQQSAAFHPGWFNSSVPAIGLADWQARTDLTPQRDVVVLPETFITELKRYGLGLPKVVFNQNGSYSFGLDPNKLCMPAGQLLDFYRHPSIAQVLCVSKHDERLLLQGFGLERGRVSRLVNGIETDLFHPSGPKRRQIAYMPRKNARDAAVVEALLRSQPWWEGWELVPIHHQPQAEVARILQQSLVFLAFGHPEGFGLPLAEAMACGCAVVGYSGLGGQELLALGAKHGVALEVPYGHWLGFVEAVAAFHRSLQKQPSAVMAALLAASKDVRSQYNPVLMQHCVAAAMARWEAQLDAPSQD